MKNNDEYLSNTKVYLEGNKKGLAMPVSVSANHLLTREEKEEIQTKSLEELKNLVVEKGYKIKGNSIEIK